MTYLTLSSDTIETNLSGVTFCIDAIPFLRATLLRHEILDGCHSSSLLSYSIFTFCYTVNGDVQFNT